MKIRSLLTFVAMLSVLLFGIGTAYAVYGVDDAVPGRDVAFPVICSSDSGTVNTGWAIADVLGITDTTTTSSTFHIHLTIHEPVNSGDVGDHDYHPTWHDVFTDTCSCIMTGSGCGVGQSAVASNPAALVQTISGHSYYVAYVTYQQQTQAGESSKDQTADRLVPWVYLTDLVNGYASGFNGVTLEGPAAFGTELEENASSAVTARSIFPRFVVQNNSPESHTWWMLLFGRSDLPTKKERLS